jgi:hypothetical protein
LSATKKYPCQGLIKRILKLNDGEEIDKAELIDLKIQLDLFPQCLKYLNSTGLAILKKEYRELSN